MRVEKREFAWEFSQISCPGETRTGVAWALRSESFPFWKGIPKFRRPNSWLCLKLTFLPIHIFSASFKHRWSNGRVKRRPTLARGLRASRRSSLSHWMMTSTNHGRIWRGCDVSNLVRRGAIVQRCLKTRRVRKCSFPRGICYQMKPIFSLVLDFLLK